MVCGVCKKSIPETARFCVHCGAKVEIVASAPDTKVETKPIEKATPVVVPAPDLSSSKPEAAGTEAPQNASVKAGAKTKSKAINVLIWILAVIFLLCVGAAGGYFFYNSFIKIDDPTVEKMTASPVAPAEQTTSGGPSDTAVVPPSSGQTPSQEQIKPGTKTPAQAQVPLQPPPAQPASTVEIKASALTNDVIKGRPAELSTKFKYGESRVAHYVQYAQAVSGQTIFSSEFYKDGKLLFKCAATPLRNAAGNYFCRPQQEFDEGNYEVRFSIDGVPKETLRFSVSY